MFMVHGDTEVYLLSHCNALRMTGETLKNEIGAQKSRVDKEDGAAKEKSSVIFSRGDVAFTQATK